jgi:hypothetical protein
VSGRHTHHSGSPRTGRRGGPVVRSSLARDLRGGFRAREGNGMAVDRRGRKGHPRTVGWSLVALALALVPGPMWTFGFFPPLLAKSPGAAWALLAVPFGGLLVLAAVRARAGTRKAPDWLGLDWVRSRPNGDRRRRRRKCVIWDGRRLSFFLWTCGYGPLTTKDFNLDGADLRRARTRQRKNGSEVLQVNRRSSHFFQNTIWRATKG